MGSNKKSLKSGRHSRLGQRTLMAISRLLSPFLKTDPEFLELFIHREGKELLGKKLRSFWVLCAIMTTTFLAIGFSNGSLKYLEKKMNDPFINWVKIDLPRLKTEEEKNKLKNDLELPLNIKRFNYRSVAGYYKFSFFFYSQDQKKLQRMTGRSIDWESPLLDKIYNENNLVGANSKRYSSAMDLGLIVTEKFISSLNYRVDQGFAWFDLNLDVSYPVQCVPIPIIAVVKELPDMADFAVTPYFYNQRYNDFEGYIPFHPSYTRNVVIAVPPDEITEDFKSKIQGMLDTMDICKDHMPEVERIKDYTQSYRQYKEVRISFYPDLDTVVKLNDIYKRIIKNLSLKNTYQLYDFNTTFYDRGYDYNYLAVYFKSLDKIREFKDFLFNEYGFELDMAQVDSKENFNFITRLTRSISFILLIFCILSISLYLSNLLKNHLIRIKTNIGTFKAFGLGTKLLKRTYFSIVGLFISFSLIISLLLSYIIGEIGGIRLVLKLSGLGLESGQNYFQLTDWWTLAAILAILFVSLSAIYLNNNKLFEETPGNLINNR